MRHPACFTGKEHLQLPPLARLLIRLHLIADLKRLPIPEAHAAFSTFAHLRDVLLDVLKRVDVT